MGKLRMDLCITISLTSFQAFDHGEEIEKSVPQDWKLQPGDAIYWQCAQLSGLAMVVRRSKDKKEVYVLKKYN